MQPVELFNQEEGGDPIKRAHRLLHIFHTILLLDKNNTLTKLEQKDTFC